MTLALGIDLGGTKIEIIGLDEEGAVLLRRRRPSPRGSYRATLEAIRRLVADAEAELGARATVGVGTPGAISPATGLLKNSNSTWLNGRPLDRDLAAALERPIAMANDADCLALSEATDGAAAGAATVFAVILGTGVGGGLAVHGRVLAGPNAIAGEWGHNSLPWPSPDELPGPPCYCGLSGCIETWLSGPGLARDHRAHAGTPRDPPAIVTAAAAGDPAAEATLRRYEDRLARGLASVINLLDPQAIVLGGGLSRLARLYGAVPAIWERYVFSDTVRTTLAPALHGDSSGVRGAAWLGRYRELTPPAQQSGDVISSSCSSVASSWKSP
jgi:fructokinase